MPSGTCVAHAHGLWTKKLPAFLSRCAVPTRQGDPPCASLGGTRAGSPGIWDSVTARALLRPGSAGAGRCRGPLPRVRVEAGARAVYSALPPEACFEPRCPVCLLEPQDQHPGTSARSPCCPQGRRTTQGLPASGSTVRPVRVRIPEPPTAALLSGRRHPHFTGGGL